MTAPRYDSSGKLSLTYRKWSSMRQRCENPKHLAYAFYGGRGVRVAERWKSFDAFYEDMGSCPAGSVLALAEGKNEYAHGNCRWVTREESARNRRQGGKDNRDPESLAEKARAAGLPYGIVYQRVKRLHWPLDQALSRPLGERRTYPAHVRPKREVVVPEVEKPEVLANGRRKKRRMRRTADL